MEPIPQNLETASKEELKAGLLELERQLAENETQISATETRIEQIMEQKYSSGELPRPVRPSQSGWADAPELRKALRNMRDIDEVALWYRYAPEVFKKELFTETIMQGVWSKVRESDKFDSVFKEEMRVKKRQYVMYSGDFTMGFDPNVTKKIHETNPSELDELRKLANRRLTELGPDGPGPNKKGNYFDLFNSRWIDEDGVEQKSINERYQGLIRTYNTTHQGDPLEDSVSARERKDVRFKAGMVMYNDVMQNLADNEFTLMPGMLRDLYVVMRNLNESQLQHYKDRDLDVKIPMVEWFIGQFRDEILGVREASQNNLELFSWFVNKAGQSFIPFNTIREDLKDWWEIIKALIGRPGDERVQPSKYPKLRKNPEPVMERINWYRAKKGLPAMTVDNQPFGRIGAVKL